MKTGISMFVCRSDFAHEEFGRILAQCLERQGWTLPVDTAKYVTEILVDKLDKNPWTPQPSYAETYLKTQTTGGLIALGNTCWFTRAVFPDLGQRRGINSSYYVDLGTSCYARARKHRDNVTLQHMHQHFEFLAEVAHTAIWSKGDFRSMWE